MTYPDPITRSLTYVVDILEAVERQKVGRCAASRRRSAALRAEPPSGVSGLRPAATNAGADD
jgi:hypothetical protein